MVDDEVCFEEQVDEAGYYDVSKGISRNWGEPRRHTQTHPSKSNLIGSTGCWSNAAYENKR